MKTLVSFQPHPKYDNFEGSRLRKSIKGSLEINDIEYTTSVVDYYDLVHLMSVGDEGKINDAIENNIPVVISALYCESDPCASFVEYKNKEPRLTLKALKVLNKASLVLVPSLECKSFLINEGVRVDIDVVSSGVNLSRFNFSRDDEKEIFYRYFNEDKTKKLVVSVGDYTNLEGVTTFINAAKKSPNALFYYFGPSVVGVSLKIKRLLRHAPKNVKFKLVPNDDIFRSALINASIFLYTGYSIVGYITLLDAMAAKCEIICREQPLFDDLLIDGETAHIGKFSETLVSLTKDCLEGKLASTKELAYITVQKHDINNVGKSLKWIYQQRINMKG